MSGRSLTLGNFQSIGNLKGSFYTGFSFRAAAGFAAPARLMADGGLAGADAIHGASAPWMAMEGIRAKTGATSMVMLIDQPGNPGYPNRWFIRWGHTQAAFPMIADEPMMIPDQDSIHLRYRIVIADGVWGREQVANKIASLAPIPKKG